MFSLRVLCFRYVYCVFDMCVVFSLCVYCVFGICIVFSICVVFSLCLLCFRCVHVCLSSTQFPYGPDPHQSSSIFSVAELVLLNILYYLHELCISLIEFRFTLISFQ